MPVSVKSEIPFLDPEFEMDPWEHVPKGSFDRHEAASALDLAGNDKEAARLRSCGTTVAVCTCTSDNRRWGVETTCKSRICPDCQRHLAYSFRKTLLQVLRAQKVGSGRALMLLTLTKVSTGSAPAASSVRRFMRDVKTFMSEYYPKKNRYSGKGKLREIIRPGGCGGVGVLEFGSNWHMHCHLVVIGPYISQRELSEGWLRITGDSRILDIRMVWRPAGAVTELLKYLGKIPRFNSRFVYADYIKAIKSVRRLHTFGVMYNAVHVKKRAAGMVCPVCGCKLRFGASQECVKVQQPIPRWQYWKRRLKSMTDISLAEWNWVQSTVGYSMQVWQIPDKLAPGFVF